MESYTANGNKTFLTIFKGVLISLAISFLLLFIFSLVLTYSNIQDNVISPVIIVVTAISILIGSSISNIKIKKNGLVNGGIIGGLYIAILYIISSILNWNFGLDIKSIIMIAVGIAFGILGGIIGVNKK